MNHLVNEIFVLSLQETVARKLYLDVTINNNLASNNKGILSQKFFDYNKIKCSKKEIQQKRIISFTQRI